MGLIQGTDGNFYGTTNTGGANGAGTVFKISPGSTLTTLYNFCSESGCTDGGGPFSAPMIQGIDGNFYGTTTGGGAACPFNFPFANCGTVFRITPGGKLTTVYNFCSQYTGTGCLDGLLPAGGLVQATDGNFYGTTSSGGVGGGGTVFKLTPEGVLTTLHSFDAQFAQPGLVANGVVQATDGNFYGTTFLGGTANSLCFSGPCGTVFSLSVGLGPFVETVPTAGKLGSAVTILGTDLTGANSVRFNGKAAAFTVVSLTEITATVPADGNTGFVTVHTPSGTLKSNVKFQVLP
jgi:uncharacterized repeat protein (TIGR03803 family)